MTKQTIDLKDRPEFDSAEDARRAADDADYIIRGLLKIKAALETANAAIDAEYEAAKKHGQFRQDRRRCLTDVMTDDTELLDAVYEPLKQVTAQIARYQEYAKHCEGEADELDGIERETRRYGSYESQHRRDYLSNVL